MKFYREATLSIRLRLGDFSGYQVLPIRISGLRVSFTIIKSLAWTTNTAVIKIWNLSQSVRNALKDYGDEVTLYAGYNGLDGSPGTSIIFIGQTTAISHQYDMPEIVTTLEVGDGEKFKNQIRVSLSYAPGSQVQQIIRDCASQMGIQLLEFAPSDNVILQNGYQFIGMGVDALSILCPILGLQHVILNNALYVIPQNGTITQPAFDVNETSGMIGVPQRFTYKSIDLWRVTPGAEASVIPAGAPRITPSQPTGYKVNVQLEPRVLPGSPINLLSQHLGVRGRFRVNNVVHEGDTFGPNWMSNLTMTEVIKVIT